MLNLKRQVIMLKIVNILLIVLIITAPILVILFPPTLCGCASEDRLVADLEYVSNISMPSNSSIGVWVKLYFLNPAETKPEKVTGVIVENDNSWVKFIFSDAKDKLLNKSGYLIEYIDKNGNGRVDTGDLLHVWGKPLSGNRIVISVVAYVGNSQLTVP